MRFTYTMNQYNAYLYSHDGQDYANDKWDYGLLKEIFDKYEVDQIRVTEIPSGDKAFVVIPGPQTAGNEELLSNELNKLSRVVLFINGDENARFDVSKIKHPNIEIWIQYPHEKHVYIMFRFLNLFRIDRKVRLSHRLHQKLISLS